jgi:parallel beta-helix repeat protein
MQKLIILAALMAGLLLTFPMQSGAAPTCDMNDAGQFTCVVNNFTGPKSKATVCQASDTTFPTIQKAVQFVSDNDVPAGPAYPPAGRTRLILVCPGTYATGDDGAGARVGIGINALTIVSTDGPRFTEVSGPFSYGFLINAHNVTIQGFTVVGGQSAPGGARNIGIFVYGGNENKVLRNVVRDAFTLGICIGSNENIVDDNKVHHNGDGIVLGHATFPSGPFVGCEGATGDANIITNNTVRSNEATGILVYGSNRNRVVGNAVHDNETGIAIIPGSVTVPALTSVEANSVHDNKIGVVERGNDTTCDGNNIRNNHDGDPPRGACASEDNRLLYIRGR